MSGGDLRPRNQATTVGGSMAPVATEDAVNGSATSAWTYDENARRLVVKAGL